MVKKNKTYEAKKNSPKCLISFYLEFWLTLRWVERLLIEKSNFPKSLGRVLAIDVSKPVIMLPFKLSRS